MVARARLLVALAGLGAAMLAGCAPGGPPADRGATPGADFRMATYNVHFLAVGDEAAGPWGPERWKRRRGPMARIMRSIGADLLALQEVEAHDGTTPIADTRLEWLLGAVPGYRAAATDFGEGVVVGQPIIYRPSEFALLDDGFALYSDTDAPFQSIRAFAGYPDAVTWARLRHRASGRAVTVFNVHLHFLDTGQRLRSARQVRALAEAARARGDTVFVIGDFNARRNSRTLRVFRDAGLRRTRQRGATFHFNIGLHLFGAIDHMLYGDGAVPVGRSVTVRRRPGGIWPSDHYPVWSDFRLVPRGRDGITRSAGAPISTSCEPPRARSYRCSGLRALPGPRARPGR
jgi:endonuclease/exonuclease/phosphatase family metal-dependent hydrolase